MRLALLLLLVGGCSESSAIGAKSDALATEFFRGARLARVQCAWRFESPSRSGVANVTDANSPLYEYCGGPSAGHLGFDVRGADGSRIASAFFGADDIKLDNQTPGTLIYQEPGVFRGPSTCNAWQGRQTIDFQGDWWIAKIDAQCINKSLVLRGTVMGR